MRLEIYKLVLPVGTLFPQEGYETEVKIALLSTCKLIREEAYPLFLSSNNFRIDFRFCTLPRWFYPPTHAFYAHVREVTFWWFPKHPEPEDVDPIFRDSSSPNLGMIRDLYKYPKLQVLHIIGHWTSRDDDYMHLRRYYRDEGVVPDYLELTGLEAFLGIPGITEITFRNKEDGRRRKDLISLGEYMTKYLAELKKGPC